MKLRLWLYAMFCAVMSVSAFAFSLDDVISPAEGKWSNLQTLCLNKTENVKEIYYSIDGSDPFVNGFVYQSEVQIPKRGDVTLKLSVFDNNGLREDFEIDFLVEQSPRYSKTDSRKSFVETLTRYPVYYLYNGFSLEIPQAFKCCIGKDINCLHSQKRLRLSADCDVERKFNFIFSDGTDNYSVLVKQMPLRKQRIVDKEVPFVVKDWNEIQLTDSSLEYSLDDGLWQSISCLQLERKESHTLRWKNKSSSDETSQSFVFPPVPEIFVQQNPDGSARAIISSAHHLFTFRGQDENFKSHCISSYNKNELLLDVLDGDEIDLDEDVKIYYDNVFQGTLRLSAKIDKKAPPMPQFNQDKKVWFSRTAYNVQLSCDEEAKIFYTITNPVSRTDSFYGLGEKYFSAVRNGEEKEYQGENLLLYSQSHDATFYRICAYSVDAQGNTSDVNTLQVIVDENNYYYNPSKKFKKDISYPLGSYQNPFVNFSEALAFVNRESNSRLHLLADVEIENSTLTFRTDLSIEGSGTKIRLDKNSKIAVTNSAVRFKNLSIEQELSSGNTQAITVTNGSLSLDNVQLDIHSKNKLYTTLTAIQCERSELNLNHSHINLNTKDAACCVNGKNTKATVQYSNLSCSGSKAYVMNLSSSVLIFMNSRATIGTQSGECIHLEKSSASCASNVFVLKSSSLTPEEKNPVVPKAFYRDRQTTLLEYTNNILRGF